MPKKIYIKPVILKEILDYSISLQMLSNPGNPTPRTAPMGTDQKSAPFEGPFEKKPFG
jgi:hypothetical protein